MTLVQRATNYVTYTAAVTLLLCHANILAAQEIDGNQLLDPNRLIEINIELSADEWTQLCRQARNPMTTFSGLPSESPYTYFKASMWIDGVKIESVGVRKKGYFGSADSVRPSLKIKFDEYEEQDPIEGLSRLTLNNNKQDGSQLSQYLAYRLFRRAGNPAPRSNWAHVTVNGQSLGVYSNVESIKKPFLKRAFDDKSGNLYEGTLTDFHPSALTNIEVKTNDDENDLGDIKRLAEVLAAEGELDVDQLGKIINLDAFFRHWVLEGLIGFWDGYSANQNNYYLYFNPNDGGRGNFIPWGADWVFTNGGPFAQGPFGGGNARPSAIYAQSIIANRLYHTKYGAERYRETMRKILDDVWDEDVMLAEIDRAEKLVMPHLHKAQAGTSKAMNELRDFIRDRREVVDNLLKNWSPRIPSQPRKPAYVVDVGKANGSFTTIFAPNDTKEEGKSDLVIQLGGKPLELENVSVSAKLFQFRGFGGRGGPGFGGAPPLAPVNLVFSAERVEGAPVNVSFLIDAAHFKATKDALRVTGSFREGSGGGFGFGGFGGGPSRSVVGELHLTKAGTEDGDEIAGKLVARIVETHGGFFQPPGGGFGGGNQRPGERPQRPINDTPREIVPAKPLSLQHALDIDRDGIVSAEEIENAAAVLKRFDRNRDGRLTDDELQTPPHAYPHSSPSHAPMDPPPHNASK